jgi:hypothetical protein
LDRTSGEIVPKHTSLREDELVTVIDAHPDVISSARAGYVDLGANAMSSRWRSYVQGLMVVLCILGLVFVVPRVGTMNSREKVLWGIALVGCCAIVLVLPSSPRRGDDATESR